MGKTMYQKIWDAHVVVDRPGETTVLYVDRHLVHEVTSPQAFDGLRAAERSVRCPAKTVATMDHNVSTRTKDLAQIEATSRLQIETLAKNCDQFDIPLFDINHPNQGIVHIIGPELGITQPGMVIVCGDSHTATHGAFGALAFGIGTSEVEHVLATQTMQQQRSRAMRITVDGMLARGVSAKDIILRIIGEIGTAGATGYVIEYDGSAITALSMEARMTICNMSIEAGARAGMIAPDTTTFEYLRGREHVPSGDDWEKALAYWKTLPSDADAEFDRQVEIDADQIKPQVTWGTSPGQVTDVEGRVPDPQNYTDPVARRAAADALAYMGLAPGTPMTDIPIDKVFIGSCTNGRIEDLRLAAQLAEGKKVASQVQALVVPGSARIRQQAEKEGLDRIFKAAGFEWRFAGCSMCLGMNDDQLEKGQRCASSSNRNFEGRQGPGGRTHLMSPQMCVAAAMAGKIADVRNYLS